MREQQHTHPISTRAGVGTGAHKTSFKKICFGFLALVFVFYLLAFSSFFSLHLHQQEQEEQKRQKQDHPHERNHQQQQQHQQETKKEHELPPPILSHKVHNENNNDNNNNNNNDNQKVPAEGQDQEHEEHHQQQKPQALVCPDLPIIDDSKAPDDDGQEEDDNRDRERDGGGAGDVDEEDQRFRKRIRREKRDDENPSILRQESQYPPPSIILPANSVRSLCWRYAMENGLEEEVLKERKRQDPSFEDRDDQRAVRDEIRRQLVLPSSSSASLPKSYSRQWWRSVQGRRKQRGGKSGSGGGGGRITFDENLKSSNSIAIATLFSRPSNSSRKYTPEFVDPRKTAKFRKAHRDGRLSYAESQKLQSRKDSAFQTADGEKETEGDVFSDDFLFRKDVSQNFFDLVRNDIVSRPFFIRRMHFLSFISKALYCLRRRKYDLIVEGASMVDRKRNSPAWSKILVLLKWIPKYTFVVWMDADTIITKPTVPLSMFLPRRKESEQEQEQHRGTDAVREDRDSSLSSAFENDSDEHINLDTSSRFHADVLLAKNHQGWNTGFMCLRGSEFSQQLLKAMWEVKDEDAWNAYQFHEQGAFIMNLDPKRVGNMQANINNFHVFELAAKDVNAIPMPVLAGSSDKDMRKYSFEEGRSFMFHFPSCRGFQSCPVWFDWSFGWSISDTIGQFAGFPPPPSVLAREFNISIGTSSFRVLGSAPDGFE